MEISAFSDFFWGQSTIAKAFGAAKTAVKSAETAMKKGPWAVHTTLTAQTVLSASVLQIRASLPLLQTVFTIESTEQSTDSCLCADFRPPDRAIGITLPRHRTEFGQPFPRDPLEP